MPCEREVVVLNPAGCWALSLLYLITSAFLIRSLKDQVDAFNRLYELRRGLKRTADIYSLSFSPCGHFLACSSNTETVHVFRLEDKPKDR